MNYLKQLTLTNFQKHDALTLDFTPGINVLYGSTGAGKSCVRRALAYLFFNEGVRNDGLRKDLTKPVSVRGVFSSGAIVERIKSNTVNRYVLTVGTDVKEFNSIGKTIPEEIRTVLGVRLVTVDKDQLNLNISKQQKLPFLLDQSGAFRAKLFNQLTGTDVLDKVASGLNKDILHVGKVEKLEKERLIEQQTQLQECSEKRTAISSIYNNIKALNEKIVKMVNQHQQLNNHLQKLTTLNHDHAKVTLELQNIKLIDPAVLSRLNAKIQKWEVAKGYLQRIDNNHTTLKTTVEGLSNVKVVDSGSLLDIEVKITQWDELSGILNKLKNNTVELANVDTRLNAVVIPNVNITVLNDKLKGLDKWGAWLSTLGRIGDGVGEVDLQLQSISEKIKTNTNEYKKVLKQYGKCPTCHVAIDETILAEIRL